MKKFMIGLLFIILLSTTLSANAETVVLKSNYYDKPLDSCYEYHDVLVKSNDGILFWWTGTEFIKCSLLDTKFTKSDDLVEWSDIDISYDVRMKISGLHRANIKHYGDKYIVYNEILDFIKELEDNGDVFVIRPKKPVNIGRTEKNREKLEALYNDGYNDAKDCYEELLKYLGKENL